MDKDPKQFRLGINMAGAVADAEVCTRCDGPCRCAEDDAGHADSAHVERGDAGCGR